MIKVGDIVENKVGESYKVYAVDEQYAWIGSSTHGNRIERKDSLYIPGPIKEGDTVFLRGVTDTLLIVVAVVGGKAWVRDAEYYVGQDCIMQYETFIGDLVKVTQ